MLSISFICIAKDTLINIYYGLSIILLLYFNKYDFYNTLNPNM